MKTLLKTIALVAIAVALGRMSVKRYERIFTSQSNMEVTNPIY